MSDTAQWDDLARHAEAIHPDERDWYVGPGLYEVYAGDGSGSNPCVAEMGEGGLIGRRTARFIAAANPATILHLVEELRRAKRAAQTLGRVIEQQGRDVLDATGMHHVIDETGDGDWAVVWEVLADQAVERRHMAARLAAVEALTQQWSESVPVSDLRTVLTEGGDQ